MLGKMMGEGDVCENEFGTACSNAAMGCASFYMCRAVRGLT